MIDVFVLKFTPESSRFDLPDWSELFAHFVNNSDGKFAHPFQGQCLTAHWKEVELVLSGASLCDDWELAAGQGFFVCAGRHVGKYGPSLESYGDLLPATYRGQSVSVFSCTNVVDALDLSKTKYELGHVDGPLIDMKAVAFEASRVFEPQLFRTPKLLSYAQFVSVIDGKNDFIDLCARSKVNDCHFDHIWQEQRKSST